MTIRFALLGMLGIAAVGCTGGQPLDPGGEPDASTTPAVASDGGSNGGSETPTASVPAATLRANLLANLLARMNQPDVLFGQEEFNVTGANPDGTQWWATDTSLDTSDAKTVSGEHPAILGIDVFDLAIKPSTWTPASQVFADAAKLVYSRGGIVTMVWHMDGCAVTTSFEAAGNEACLCKIANDDAYARTFLIDNGYKLYADALIKFGLDQIPIIFRPMHEQTGSWFWWGDGYWNCSSYVSNPKFTGAAAYTRVWQTIVNYLRVERGLDNLLFAYSPNSTSPNTTATYLNGYPGDAYVDIMGDDSYYNATPSYASQTAANISLMAMVTSLAQAHHKVAALTEVGDNALSTLTTPSSETWYASQLLPLLQGAGVHLAYALTWQNTGSGSESFWVPYPGSAGVGDFQKFEQSSITTFLPEVPALYTKPAGQWPVCLSCASSDTNGDGWGWENNASCIVASWCITPQYPECKLCASTDSEHDGWGWENNRSCIIDASCQ